LCGIVRLHIKTQVSMGPPVTRRRLRRRMVLSREAERPLSDLHDGSETSQCLR
jgi:hypothetical protein